MSDDVLDPIVFIVDDDKGIRDTLVQLVSSMNLPARSFESAEAFLEFYDPTCIGCLILDVRMPGMSGIELQEHLVSNQLTIPVIVITGQGDIPMCVEVMKKGAVDFIEKPYRINVLSRKILNALELVTKQRARRQQEEQLQSRFERLDRQEEVILRKIVSGVLNRDIASELDISLRTMQLRRANIMRKLEVDSRSELVRVATMYDFVARSNRAQRQDANE